MKNKKERERQNKRVKIQDAEMFEITEWQSIA